MFEDRVWFGFVESNFIYVSSVIICINNVVFIFNIKKLL